MKLRFLSLGFVGFAAFAIALAAPAFADTNYPFTLRGVTDVKAPTKSLVYVTVTAGSSKAFGEVKNQNIAYSISTAKVYGYVNGVKRLESWKQLKLGQEVVMKGKKVGNTFKVSELTINDRTFEIIGKVTDVNTDDKTISVNVMTSTYREKGIKSTEIKMEYTPSTVCKRLGSTVGCDTVDVKHQVIRAKGEVTGVDQVYTLNNFWDNFK
ncbi:MAG: hypothetical protein K8Q97_04170 [Candidatus Andersenbacteria bacterium]|nr:hypothetical protein [Candidatus Andersenbacteria bacterium]